jgi:hypothetical protein
MTYCAHIEERVGTVAYGFDCPYIRFRHRCQLKQVTIKETGGVAALPASEADMTRTGSIIFGHANFHVVTQRPWRRFRVSQLSRPILPQRLIPGGTGGGPAWRGRGRRIVGFVELTAVDYLFGPCIVILIR